jgi:hypothetical protein
MVAALASTEMMQGKGNYPLPLHPIPNNNNRRLQKSFYRTVKANACWKATQVSRYLTCGGSF